MESEEGFDHMDEDNTIEFPPELSSKLASEKCETCSMAELLAIFENKRNNEKKNLDYENEVVKMTKEHLDKFNRYNINQNRIEIALILKKIFKKDNDEKFTNVEQTLLIDLAPGNAEEAFSLIPSLKSKFKSEEINEILNELNKNIIGK